MYDYSCLNLLMKTIVNISLHGLCFIFSIAECLFSTAERTFRNGERLFRSGEQTLNTLSSYIMDSCLCIFRQVIYKDLDSLSWQFHFEYNEIEYTGYRQAYRKGTPDAYKTEAEINA